MGNNYMYIGTKCKHTSKQFFQTKLCLAIVHGHIDQPEIRKDSFSIQHTEPEVAVTVQTTHTLAALCLTLSSYIGGPVFIPVYGS